MGTWGTSIFEDDTAADVRADYRELLEGGLKELSATDRMIRDYAEYIEDEVDGPVFWLALAVAQWELGRLESRVADKALKVISTGADLLRWEGSEGAAERSKVLEATKVQLLSPQCPAPRQPFSD